MMILAISSAVTACVILMIRSITERSVLQNLIWSFRKLKKGRATDLLFSASQGLVASVTGPFGRLVIPQRLPPRIILVATSVGIAPYLPMLRQLEIPLAAGEVQLTFLFGARDASEILYADFLVDYQQKYAASVDFRVSLSRDMAVSEPSIASYVHAGYVQQQLAQLELDASKDLVMLCGNPAMVDECFDLLKHRRLCGSSGDQRKVCVCKRSCCATDAQSVDGRTAKVDRRKDE
jgi:NAD(P)H-flavin reductase